MAMLLARRLAGRAQAAPLRHSFAAATVCTIRHAQGWVDNVCELIGNTPMVRLGKSLPDDVVADKVCNPTFLALLPKGGDGVSLSILLTENG